MIWLGPFLFSIEKGGWFLLPNVPSRATTIGAAITFPFMVSSTNTNITKTTQNVYHSYVGSSRFLS